MKATISVLKIAQSLSYDITAYFDTGRRNTRRKEREKGSSGDAVGGGEEAQ
jgi:hypothetical protein